MAEASDRLRVRRENVVWREVEGEVVVLDLDDSVYLSLNSSAAVLWGALVEGASPSQLEDLLVERFGISRDVAERDVGAFLEECRGRDLLEEARDEA